MSSPVPKLSGNCSLVFAPKQTESSPALFDQLLHSQRESENIFWKITLGPRADNFANSGVQSKKQLTPQFQQDSKIKEFLDGFSNPIVIVARCFCLVLQNSSLSPEDVRRFTEGQISAHIRVAGPLSSKTRTFQ